MSLLIELNMNKKVQQLIVAISFIAFGFPVANAGISRQALYVGIGAGSSILLSTQNINSLSEKSYSVNDFISNLNAKIFFGYGFYTTSGMYAAAELFVEAFGSNALFAQDTGNNYQYAESKYVDIVDGLAAVAVGANLKFGSSVLNSNKFRITPYIIAGYSAIFSSTQNISKIEIGIDASQFMDNNQMYVTLNGQNVITVSANVGVGGGMTIEEMNTLINGDGTEGTGPTNVGILAWLTQAMASSPATAINMLQNVDFANLVNQLNDTIGGEIQFSITDVDMSLDTQTIKDWFSYNHTINLGLGLAMTASNTWTTFVDVTSPLYLIHGEVVPSVKALIGFRFGL